MKFTSMTKKALISSLLSVVLCVSMLLGTTYAWFTDSVTSGSNLIQSGNLDIEVQYTLDGETWNDLDGATDLFTKGLWEPGHTEVVALRITNNGSLALKYSAMLNATETVGKTQDGKDILLSDILTITTVNQQTGIVGDILLGLVFGGSQNTDTNNIKLLKDGMNLAADQELNSGDAHYLIITIDMPETIGNEANYAENAMPSITFTLDVLATQRNYEKDTFGTDYDKDATYPEN